MNEARMLVQLITYHALLQREDLKLQCADTPEKIMALTTDLSNLYLERVLGDEMGEKDGE
jgi:hypothetical protein